ncbi:zinc ribbon domain-containing protein [Thalassobacillus pellis]|uniref:zinc ribbon domain-containing protein n=1 Tax=Thalassobacillus pellis TaxID=748008 RepID=UPI00195F52BA|nr:zinc ribbon domain-containing protein [Thalassobacillus pellis]MBM7551621.1 hypothetical protein [Thalassobacillus pellis]
MQYCANCQAPHPDGKFCGNCGKLFKPLDTSAIPTETPRPSPAYTPSALDADVGAQPLQTTPHGGYTTRDTYHGSTFNFKQSGKSYFEYFKAAGKNPTAVLQSTAHDIFANARITFLLFIIFSGLMMYYITKTMTSFFDVFGFGFNVPFMAVFFPVAIVAGIVLLLVSVTIFLLTKINNNQPPTFKEVFGSLITFLTIPTLLLALTCLFLVAGLVSLVPFANALTGFGIAAAVPFTLYSLHQKQSLGIDPFLHTLFTYLVLFLLTRMIIMQVVSSITNMFNPF